MRASVEAEKIGIRTASIVASAFASQARPIARSLGFENLALAEYPGVIMLDTEEEFRQKVASIVVERIVDGLASPVELTAAAIEPEPRDVAFAGTLAEVEEHFHEKAWSDGLPIIPPTVDKVEEFLRFTDRSPDEVIGILLPEKREATVWNVAVNGVMAGCRPEYMPILLAVVECIADPEWRIVDAGSTPGWEPLIIVNGPIVKQLNFNYEAGALRVGRQANTSIGRFLKLYTRNVAGVRLGSTDKSTIGFTFNVALAENEDVVAELGWKPLSVERGFLAGENVVTVQSVLAISPPIYVGGSQATDLVQTIAEVWGKGDIAYWAWTGMLFGKWHPLLVLSPSIAWALARDGWTKDDVKRYLFENVQVPAGLEEKYAWQTGGGHNNLCQMVEEGTLSREYCTSSDPNRLVPAFLRPEWIGIVVAGDAGRNQARGYTSNHEQGPPVSRKIELPPKWQEMLGRSEKQR